ncbi:MAG: hypothetical protein CHACPFDD_01531 [Phycisphaerae bacterium]|nr:hypothetical protein [Phycisphaerae bacterium]
MLFTLASMMVTPISAADAAACGPSAAPRTQVRPVHTYSIVARDPKTGELGVAVQSHWFSVGPIVPWAEAGVGAVATQSFADPAYGPIGLQMMRGGRSAPDALRGALEADAGREVRQVAMIDAAGRVAAHTGARCIAAAGHNVDAEHQFSVQANLMEKPSVWPAMAEAYRQSTGDLAERMLAALEAAEREGGDIRGRQSAAMLIVKGTSSGRPWEDRVLELRVEDHPEPLKELRRLVQIHRAYAHTNAGDVALEKNDFDTANREYAAAASLAPEIVEIRFWQAATLARLGKVDAALPIFRDVFARERRWVELVPRLVTADLLPDDPALLDRIRSQAP